MYDLYTREHCPSCRAVKDFLTENFALYREHVIGRDITLEEVKEMFPGVGFLPIIVLDECRITGIDELKELYGK